MPLKPLEPWVAVALVAALCAAPYAFGGPVWDDHTLVFGRLVHLDGGELAALWWSPVGGGEVGAGYYRPVAMTALAILGKGGVLPIHLLALVAHALGAGLLTRVLQPAPGAVLAGLVFAVHPLASEVLGWASALPDALAVSFAIAGALAARRSLLGAGALTLLGLLSKESAVLVLPVLVAAGRVPRRAMGAWAVACGVGACLRLAVGAGGGWSLAGKAALAPAAVLWTVGAVAVPWPLTAVRDLHALPVWGWGAGIAVLLALGLGAWARRSGGLGATAGAALVVAAPVIALPTVLTGYLAAERYAYVGLVGVSVWLAAVIRSPPSLRRPVWGALLAAAVLIHVNAAERWTDDRSLFGSATERLPQSAYAWHFLGQAEAMAGEFNAAADAFARANALPNAHPLDPLLELQALVLAGRGEDAWALAQSSASTDLTAADLAWRARAARDVGQLDAARALLTPLRTAAGWAGPEWVGALATELGL